MKMSNVDTTALRKLLKKWQAIEDLAPSSSTIFVGERQGILLCADQLEKVIEEMEHSRTPIDMDPYNTSGDRPKHTSRYVSHIAFDGKIHKGIIK
jgi:hypothetical protein